MRVLFSVLLSFLIVIHPALAQGEENYSREQYIDTYKDVAIRNMLEFKIPASITLAQACLESGNGNSELSKRSNNHFGIKCHSDWNGKRTYHDDDRKKECFRVYDHVYDSYADHSRFLQKTRYEKCFQLKITDYKGWAHELKRAGYATNPKYPQLLIKIIEDNELWRIDDEVVKKGEGALSSKQVLTDFGKPEGSKNTTKPKSSKDNKGSKNDEFGVIDMYGSFSVRKSENKIKYVEAKGGESIDDIARALELGPWQIRKYNDLDKSHKFKEGDVVYLQPKRGKAKTEYHTVKAGETVEQISQKYGIRINAIYRKNRMKKGEELKAGQKLYLRKKKPKS